MEEEKESRTIKDELKSLNEKILEITKNNEGKKFKLPWKAKMGSAKRKKGWVIVCYINENKNVDFIKTRIQEGTVMMNDTPYLASANYMLTYRKNPMLIIPAWNVKPFSPEENMQDAEKEKSLSIGYRYLYNAMKNELLTAKKKINAWVLLGGLAVIIGLIYLASKSGGLKLF